MTIPMLRPPTRHAAVALGLVLGTSTALGAGFQLNETSASGLGNAFAGGAAAAEDATTLWSNAAGMSRIRTAQGVGAIHFIKPSLRFTNEASLPATSKPMGGEGGDAGGLNIVPNLYAVLPLDAQWAVGLGVTAPFGLVTEYDDAGWVGRFQAVRSSIQTFNVNPAVSWKPAGNVALGLGLNIQRMSANFTNQVNYSAALLGAAATNGIAPGSATFNAIAQSTTGLSSGADITGADNAFGWNAGVLWDLDERTRVGAHYRSGMAYHLSGTATFSNPVPVVPPALAPVVGALSAGVNSRALYDTGVTADVKLPAIVNLSMFTTLGAEWDLMADAQWTQWSTIQTLSFVRTDGTVLQSTPENFRDAWKLAVGANYRYRSDWMFRGGLAFDQSPVQAAYRTPRLPDADRTWLTAGAQYRANPKLRLDVSAAYLWVKTATIDINGSPPSTAAYGLLNGHYDNSTVIVSAQATYSF
jgi:long-chain fatty acid transport protein